jgi:hypothetical protein
MRRLFALILLLTSALTVHADSADRVSVRPWVELEPLVRIDPASYPLPMDAARKSLLDEGRLLASGMVYGWTFTYYPGDRGRKVQESFTLTPVAEIPWGNPRLRVTETEVTDTRLWGRVFYSLSDEESRRRAAWESNTADLSTGTGTASLLDGAPGKSASLREAIRDAIRRSLDVRYVNKPREISGDVVLWEDPQIVVRSGTYTATAKVKIAVRELVPYRIF